MVRIFILLLLISNVSAQSIYCSLDNNTSSPVTLSNLVLYSEQLDNAAWTKTALTITADSITAPNGTTTADLITNTVANSQHEMYSTGITVVAASVYRMSIYMKYGTYAYVLLESQSPATAYLGIDLSTGSIGKVGSAVLSYSMTSVGNGWYLVSFTYTKSAGVTDYITMSMVPSTYDTTTSWIGTTAQTVYMWGASLRLASSPADYLITTAASATLGPICGSYQTPSPLNPSLCLSLTDRRREIRTEAQIAIGSQ